MTPPLPLPLSPPPLPLALAQTPPTTSAIPPAVVDRIADLQRQHHQIGEQIETLSRLVKPTDEATSRLEIFHGYIGVFIVAFLVVLIATPIMRRLAVANGVIDRPLEARKAHRIPVAYLGGAAVYLGLLIAILFSYTADLHGLITFHPSKAPFPGGVPLSILLGMTIIMIVGLLDDVFKISPRIKIAGQLVAAAALAVENVGVKLASQVMIPPAQALGLPVQQVDGISTVAFSIPLPIPIAGFDHIPIDIVYWVGTGLIALFVLGACNASNLIDGLDGLLSGTTAIAAAALLMIALTLAFFDDGGHQPNDLDAARIILCMALLGACLGFLPHNFNPATIFLGDAGSLLLGYCTIVIILTLGDTGRTNLVVAGLVVYFLPIIDTTLAIVRRKVSGKRISDPDDQHLHHMLKRALGVKGAVFVMYLIAASFGAFGVALTMWRARTTYAIFLVFAAFIGVTAFKIARRKHIEEQAAASDARRARAAADRAPVLPDPIIGVPRDAGAPDRAAAAPSAGAAVVQEPIAR